MKRAHPAHHAVPISKTIRAGDFVYTSAYGPWIFDPADLTYDEAGNILEARFSEDALARSMQELLARDRSRNPFMIR